MRSFSVASQMMWSKPWHLSFYKTTDAGATWNQLPSFDWTAMPLMEEWMFATVDAGEYIPYFEQVSATVDVTGRLHIFF